IKERLPNIQSTRRALVIAPGQLEMTLFVATSNLGDVGGGKLELAGERLRISNDDSTIYIDPTKTSGSIKARGRDGKLVNIQLSMGGFAPFAADFLPIVGSETVFRVDLANGAVGILSGRFQASGIVRTGSHHLNESIYFDGKFVANQIDLTVNNARATLAFSGVSIDATTAHLQSGKVEVRAGATALAIAKIDFGGDLTSQRLVANLPTLRTLSGTLKVDSILISSSSMATGGVMRLSLTSLDKDRFSGSISHSDTESFAANT